MSLDRRSLMGTALAAGFLATRAAADTPPPETSGGVPPGLPDPTETIDLWPGEAPGAPSTPLVETVQERSKNRLLPDRAVWGISKPRLVVFRPTRPNGGAVLISPGGGYRYVVIDKEGYEMGRWLSARGYTAFVLFYRLPGEGWADRANVPLQDAQRAMRLIRQRAQDYAIVPERVAAMGFSAGGHVCADLAARFASKVYEPVDEADKLTARPVCAAPIYPVVSMDPAIAHPGSRALLLGPDPTPAMEAAHSPDRNEPADPVPHFLCQAEDDPAVPVANTVRLRAALKARKARVETHPFEHGGHGFGLRYTVGKPVAAWPHLWHDWVRTTDLG